MGPHRHSASLARRHGSMPTTQGARSAPHAQNGTCRRDITSCEGWRDVSAYCSAACTYSNGSQLADILLTCCNEPHSAPHPGIGLATQDAACRSASMHKADRAPWSTVQACNTMQPHPTRALLLCPTVHMTGRQQTVPTAVQGQRARCSASYRHGGLKPAAPCPGYSWQPSGQWALRQWARPPAWIPPGEVLTPCSALHGP